MELIRKSDAMHAVLHNQGDAAVAAVQAIKPINPHGELREMLIDEMIDKGEWIDENRRTRSSKFVCSTCKRTCYDIQPTRDKAWTKRCRYNYCPNCGARMRTVTDWDILPPYDRFNITHWMPLPDAPEVEG